MQIGWLTQAGLPREGTRREDRDVEVHACREVVDVAQLAEALGFDCVWVGMEHARSGDASALALILAAMAARTKTIRLGALAVPADALDPVRLAEDYATLDGLSAGRMNLALGASVPADQVDTSTLQDSEAQARLRESVELLHRLWSEDAVTWSGQYRAPLSNLTVEPRPLQQPHPPIWVAGHDASCADLAGELGLPLMLMGVSAPSEAFTPLVARYRERFHRASHAVSSPRVGAVSSVCMGGSAPAGAAICGSPAEVASSILGIRERLGLDLHLSECDTHTASDPVYRETLECFAADVLPKLRDQP